MEICINTDEMYKRQGNPLLIDGVPNQTASAVELLIDEKGNSSAAVVENKTISELSVIGLMARLNTPLLQEIRLKVVWKSPEDVDITIDGQHVEGIFIQSIKSRITGENWEVQVRHMTQSDQKIFYGETVIIPTQVIIKTREPE